MGICCSCCKNSDEKNNYKNYNNDSGNVNDNSSAASAIPQHNDDTAANQHVDNRSNASETSSQSSTVIYSINANFGERMGTLTLDEDRNLDIGNVDRMEAPYPHFLGQPENSEEITIRNTPRRS